MPSKVWDEITYPFPNLQRNKVIWKVSIKDMLLQLISKAISFLFATAQLIYFIIIMLTKTDNFTICFNIHSLKLWPFILWSQIDVNIPLKNLIISTKLIKCVQQMLNSAVQVVWYSFVWNHGFIYSILCPSYLQKKNEHYKHTYWIDWKCSENA